MENDWHGLNKVVVFLRGETLFFQREEMFGKNGNIFNLWIRTFFWTIVVLWVFFRNRRRLQYDRRIINIIMILDVKRGKMQIMFIRAVLGRIILRCLIVQTIIFDKCLFMDERRRFRCVCSETRLWTDVAHIAQTTVNTQMSKNGK